MADDKLLVDDIKMEDLLREVGQGKAAEGEVVSARVLGITNEGVFVDVGLKSEGFIPASEFANFKKDPPFQIGDQVPVVIRQMDHAGGHPLVSWRRARERVAWQKIVEGHQKGLPVSGRIIRKVKGGFIVDVGMEAFLPGSQVDARPVKDPDSWLGQEAQFLVTEVESSTSNIVVSRRRLLEQERLRKREETLATLAQGEVRQGGVTGITHFGAFIDIGGIEGLLHVSDLSWQRTAKIESLLHVGQILQVKVLKYEPTTQRISLGLKQLTPHPWEGVAARYPAGSLVKGRVTTLTSFGAFVEIEPGVEGLLHVSEISWREHVTHPQEKLQPGQEIEARVLLVDAVREKLSLSLKRVGQSPWEEVKIHHPVGSRVQGQVTHLTSFGAFVMLPEGIEGLIHVSDLSWGKRVKHPSEMIQQGQEVEAVVLDVKPEAEKIVLSLKHLQPDPFATHRVGQVVQGRVVRTGGSGAMVELPDGLEGWVRGSEYGGTETLQPPVVGEEITAKVIRLNGRERRLELSIRRYEKDREKEAIAKYTDPEPLTWGEALDEENPQ